MIEVRNNGVPLIEEAPKAAITQSILGLAEALSSDQKSQQGEPQERKSGIGKLLNLWGSKGGK